MKVKFVGSGALDQSQRETVHALRTGIFAYATLEAQVIWQMPA